MVHPENDLLEPEIQPNLPENSQIWHFFRTRNPQKVCPLRLTLQVHTVIIIIQRTNHHECIHTWY